jgi:hypothetical protein
MEIGILHYNIWTGIHKEKLKVSELYFLYLAIVVPA